MTKYNKDYTHTNMELIHNWANRLFKTNDEYISDNYAVKEGILYRTGFSWQTEVVAYYYKDCFFIKNFDHRYTRYSRYNDKLNTRLILDSIPSDLQDKIFVFNQLPEKEYFNNPLSKTMFKRWYSNEFIEYNKSLFKDASDIKEFCYNNRRKALHLVYKGYDYNPTRLNIHYYIPCAVPLPKSFIKGKKQWINDTFIDAHIHKQLWRGWASSDFTSPIHVNGKIKNLITTNLITYADEKQYNYRIWHITYGKGYPPSKTKKIYNDTAQRHKRENEVIQENIRLEEIIIKKKLERTKKLVQNHIDKLNTWQNNNNLEAVSSHGISGAYESIKLIDSITPFVFTSLSVKISIDDAKKAYLLFKRYKGKHHVFPNPKPKVGSFYISGVEDETVLRYVNSQIIQFRDSCLLVGCHTIPWFEVERFINKHNLNW